MAVTYDGRRERQHSARAGADPGQGAAVVKAAPFRRCRKRNSLKRHQRQVLCPRRIRHRRDWPPGRHGVRPGRRPLDTEEGHADQVHHQRRSVHGKLYVFGGCLRGSAERAARRPRGVGPRSLIPGKRWLRWIGSGVRGGGASGRQKIYLIGGLSPWKTAWGRA